MKTCSDPIFPLAVLVLACAICTPACADDATPRPKPCSAPEYRQFDFWIGEWDVTTPDGKAAGHNRIEAIENGCALQENWTSAGGFTGRSLNSYDAKREVWHQTWVDFSGNLLLLEGGLKGRVMTLGNADGDKRNRITWTPQKDGSVVQVWDASKDGGATWTNIFHGIYRKKK